MYSDYNFCPGDKKNQGPPPRSGWNHSESWETNHDY